MKKWKQSMWAEGGKCIARPKILESQATWNRGFRESGALQMGQLAKGSQEVSLHGVCMCVSVFVGGVNVCCI